MLEQRSARNGVQSLVSTTVPELRATIAPPPSVWLDAPALECGSLYRVVFDGTPFGGFRATFLGWEPSRLGLTTEAGRVAAWDNGIRLAEGNWRVERVLSPPGVSPSDVAA